MLTVLTMYMVLHVCEFTKWHSYTLWFKSNIRSP